MKNILMITVLAASGFLNIAQAGELAVVVGANSPASTMSADQVAQIFLGKSTSLVPGYKNENAEKT
jgi:hypothetical protein